MSLQKIRLKKLLQLFYAKDALRRRILLADIRQEEAKEDGDAGGGDGGDFHGPFWTDAKAHVAGTLDLRKQCLIRVANNRARARLYPLLTEGFLNWWDQKRRWKNERFEFIPQSVKARYEAPGLGVVKVENLLALRVGDEFSRLFYPYFSEEPELPAEGARIGLWVLAESITAYGADDMRVLDVLRGTSYSNVDLPFEGNEKALFTSKYAQVLEEWEKLRQEREP